jgi:hypothetical protein
LDDKKILMPDQNNKLFYPTSPIDWMCEKAPGFAELSNDERDAIMHFSLLWSLFEGTALGTHASADRILGLSHEWASTGRLNFEWFSSSLAYFKDRYFKNGEETEYFVGLHLRRNDSPDLVRTVLNGENTNPADSVAALLIVVLRLRNNLFHGVKWAYEIRGQLDNFTNANIVLMAALEIHGKL